MRKILFIFSAVVISLALCLGVYAEEVETAEETVEVVEETLAEEESHTITSRAWEFLTSYKTEILGAAGDLAVLVLAFFLKKKITSVKGDTSLTESSQKSVVSAVNGMIDGYNSLKESYDKYGLTENERNRITGAVLATNTAILEILTTITVNNKNTPQGVKDIAMLKYANCLKTLEDDEQLMAIVTSVRESIGTTLLVEETEEDTTNTTEV